MGCNMLCGKSHNVRNQQWARNTCPAQPSDQDKNSARIPQEFAFSLQKTSKETDQRPNKLPACWLLGQWNTLRLVHNSYHWHSCSAVFFYHIYHIERLNSCSQEFAQCPIKLAQLDTSYLPWCTITFIHQYLSLAYFLLKTGSIFFAKKAFF